MGDRPDSDGTGSAVAAYEALLALQSRGIRLGLERVRRALALLGDPQEGPPWVTIAGTNGKGSTGAFLASILQDAGYRVGLYTSPHLVHPRERIRIDGRPIDDEAFAELAARVLAVSQRHSDAHLTFFEALTCMAFLHFGDKEGDKEVEIGVLEVGLGGRLDAVNVVEPRTTVLTTVAVDHADVLGDDLLSIAREKAGILRPGVPLAVSVDDAIFRQAIGPRCLAERIPVARIGRDALFSWRDGELSYRGPRFCLEAAPLGLPGRYQGTNAALAVAAAEQLCSCGFRLRREHVARGLARARWAGRFEILATEPPFVVDAAHNPNGMAAVVRSLRDRFPAHERWHVCLAALRTKDLPGMLAELVPLTRSLSLAGSHEQGFSTWAEVPLALRRELPAPREVPDLAAAVAEARGRHARGAPTLITGSHRVVGLAV